MDINNWKCDICGKEYSKDSCGYLNRYPLNIAIDIGEWCNVIYEENYKDTCCVCRVKITDAINKTISEITK